jgi:hypothetical protein
MTISGKPTDTHKYGKLDTSLLWQPRDGGLT